MKFLAKDPGSAAFCYLAFVFVCRQCSETFVEAGFCAHDGTRLEPQANDPLIGSNIGPYRIDALIGSGGMGRVYKAVHPKIGSRVAVKVLSHDCALKPDLIARFFDEARAVNVIRHENIVNILDLDSLPDGRPYIVMEFLDGKPLSSFISKDRHLPIGTVLRVFEDVLDALQAAHGRQIVHRDLKPDNIFISPNGRPKILDFGIAKLAAEDSSMKKQTQAGSLLGTPHYMSPEQAQSRAVDARSDLYALGVILYECLTGAPPFEADNLFKLLEMHVHETPGSPRQLRPEIPPSLEAIVLRALAKDPNQRWQLAAEMRTALQAEQHGLPESQWEPIAAGGTHSGNANRPSRPPASAQGQHALNMRRQALSAPPPVSRTGGGGSRRLLIGALVAGCAALGALVWLEQTKDGDGSASEGPEASSEQSISDGQDDEVQLVQAPSWDAGAVAAAPRAVARPDAATPILENVEIEETGDPVDDEEENSDAGVPSSNQKDPKRTANGAKQTKAPNSSKPVQQASAPRVPERDSTRTASPGDFDVSGYLARARKRAKLAFDDAVLVRIDADGVQPSGKANLGLSDDFGVLYRFISPSRSKRPKDLPLGVDHKPTCLFYVSVSADGTDNYPLEGWDCSTLAPIGFPQCTAKEIWQRAIADGAPKTNAVAELGYRKSSGAKKWYFTIKGVFSQVYPDDC